jgi:hypothetical protein
VISKGRATVRLLSQSLAMMTDLGGGRSAMGMGKIEAVQCVDDRRGDGLAQEGLRRCDNEVELRLGFGRVFSKQSTRELTYL